MTGVQFGLDALHDGPLGSRGSEYVMGLFECVGGFDQQSMPLTAGGLLGYQVPPRVIQVIESRPCTAAGEISPCQAGGHRFGALRQEDRQ